MSQRTLGHYRLVRQLAVGGMAEIYVATAAGVEGFEKQLALKVIHPNFSADPEFIRMLVDEAKLAVQLQHGNIVQTYDLGAIEDRYYIVMELIDGVDLFKVLKQTAADDHYVPLEMAAFVAHEVTAGLDYAHRKCDPAGRPLGIVHRDISPQNVLLSFSGEVKIVDFGIAKARRSGTRQTAAGVIKGKYYYMSPEQAWGDPIDGRTDIFSAGILLYEMIAGEMLYYEEDFDRLLDAVRKADIRPPSTRRRGVPPDLDAIVMRALAARPEERWQTAGEMSSALGLWLRVHAPEFTPTRLGAFVNEVLGTLPGSARARPRGAREETAEVPAADVRASPPSRAAPGPDAFGDENSLIFRLEDLQPLTTGAGASASAFDEPTTQGEAPSAMSASDFSEPEATLVEGAPGTTPDASPEEPAAEPTSPRAAPPRREGRTTPSLERLDELLPLDDELTRPDGRPTLPRPAGSAPRAVLPGVRAPSQPSARSGGRAPAPDPLEASATTPRSPMPLASDDDEPTPRVPARVAVRALHEAGDDEATRAFAGRPLPLDGTPLPALSTVAATPPARQVVARPARVDDEPRMGRLRIAEAPRRASRPDARRVDELAAGGDAPTGEWRSPRLPDDGTTETPPPIRSTPAPQAPTAVSTPLPAPSRDATVLLPTPVAPPPRPEPPAPLPWPWGPGEEMPLLPTGQGGLAPPPAGQLTRRPAARAWWIVFAAAVVVTIVGLGAVVFAPYLPSRGAIAVVSLPAGAQVKIDGREAPGVTPLRLDDLDLKASHRVAVVKDGYDAWEREVQFEWGQPEMTLHAVLVPLSGLLHIESSPTGAEAIVNGRFRGQTPLDVADLLPTEDVSVELRLRGYRVERRSLAWSGRRAIDLSVALARTH